MVSDNALDIPTVLLGTTIHDLKTHLTAIIAAADLLSDELKSNSDETLSRLVRAIIRNAHNMDGKISKLLKTDTYFDGVQTTEKCTNIKTLIRDTVSEMTPILHGREQSILINTADELPLLIVHKQYMEYIIRTLLHNASKFTPPGETISLSARQEGSMVVMEVNDSGIGIPEDELDNIFQPHNQVLDGNTEDANGSGVGLTMAKYLAELNGGKMWVQSIVGKGSSFFVAVPGYSKKERQS